MNGDVREETLDILRDALAWQLPKHRWLEVERSVQALARAFAEGDQPAFRQAQSDIELAGPLRAVSAENPPDEPVPATVRERINELIHTLDGSRPTGKLAPDVDAAAD